MKRQLSPSDCSEYKNNLNQLVADIYGKQSGLLTEEQKRAKQAKAVRCLVTLIIPKVQQLYRDLVDDPQIREKINSKAMNRFFRAAKTTERAEDFDTLKGILLENYFKPCYMEWVIDDYKINPRKFEQHLKEKKRFALECFKTMTHRKVLKLSPVRDIGDEAEQENIYQEAFDAFLKQLAGFSIEKGTSPISYFMRIAYNKAMDYWRRNDKITGKKVSLPEEFREGDDDETIALEDDFLVDSEATSTSGIWDTPSRAVKALRECMERLTEKQKLVFTLRVQKWEYEDIAEEFNTSVNSSRNLASDAIRKLKKCLETKGIIKENFKFS